MRESPRLEERLNGTQERESISQRREKALTIGKILKMTQNTMTPNQTEVKPQFTSSQLWPGFNMIFENGWEISVQFGSTHYCSNRHGENNVKLMKRSSRTAEVAIFAPNKNGFPTKWWSYDENLDDVVEQPDESFVNGHLTTDQVAKIISIISKK